MYYSHYYVKFILENSNGINANTCGYKTCRQIESYCELTKIDSPI